MRTILCKYSVRPHLTTCNRSSRIGCLLRISLSQTNHQSINLVNSESTREPFKWFVFSFCTTRLSWRTLRCTRAALQSDGVVARWRSAFPWHDLLWDQCDITLTTGQVSHEWIVCNHKFFVSNSPQATRFNHRWRSVLLSSVKLLLPSPLGTYLKPPVADNYLGQQDAQSSPVRRG